MREHKEFNLPDGDWVLYILKCQHHYHYIGVSSDLRHRLSQHDNGKGSSITKLHKPIKLEGVYSIGNMSYEEAEMYEDAFALRMVVDHNSTKWRGGRYCTKIKPKTAEKKLSKIDPKYLVELPKIEFQYAFKCRGVRPRSKRPKANPWAKQEKRAKAQLRMSSNNRFGV